MPAGSQIWRSADILMTPGVGRDYRVKITLEILNTYSYELSASNTDASFYFCLPHLEKPGGIEIYQASLCSGAPSTSLSCGSRIWVIYLQ